MSESDAAPDFTVGDLVSLTKQLRECGAVKFCVGEFMVEFDRGYESVPMPSPGDVPDDMPEDELNKYKVEQIKKLMYHSA